MNTSADTARANADTVKVSARELAGISKMLHGIVEQFTINKEEDEIDSDEVDRDENGEETAPEEEGTDEEARIV